MVSFSNFRCWWRGAKKTLSSYIYGKSQRRHNSSTEELRGQQGGAFETNSEMVQNGGAVERYYNRYRKTGREACNKGEVQAEESEEDIQTRLNKDHFISFHTDRESLDCITDRMVCEYADFRAIEWRSLCFMSDNTFFEEQEGRQEDTNQLSRVENTTAFNNASSVSDATAFNGDLIRMSSLESRSSTDTKSLKVSKIKVKYDGRRVIKGG